MAEESPNGRGYAKEVDTDSVKCKGCGAAMVFDPALQLLKCTRCGKTLDFSKSADVEEIDIDRALYDNAVWKDDVIAFRCENCGATVITEKAEAATLCPFCGAGHVVAVEDMQGLKPNAVLPFSHGKEKAAEFFKAWAKRKFFAPNEFKHNITPDKLRGVYLPFFTFDSSTDSVYEGRVGDRHTRTHTDSKGVTHTETYITWRKVSGSFTHFFDDVLINAGRRLEEKKLKSLYPFDFSRMRVYENEYLTGFLAHRYERDIASCWNDAKKDIDARIRRMIISNCHCDEVAYLNVKTVHENITYKYVMLPVYVINYKYKKKNYVLYQNGSTGKTVGKSPVSALKTTLFSLGVAAAVILLLLVCFWIT